MTMKALLLFVAFCVVSGLAAAAADRPNFVVILADDLGFSDLRSYGGEAATPNLDKLAADGLRFKQFYNGARCCPTRAALLTGIYSHQAGVGHMLQDWKRPSYASALNDRSATFAEVLKDVGYRNYYVGKWHVGPLQGKGKTTHPLDRGFDRFHGTAGGGSFFDPKPLMRDRQNIKPGPDYYTTDDFSSAAVEFIGDHAKQNSDRPFLLHLCYTAPHFPLHARPEDIARYRGKYRQGWDALRAERYAKQVASGLISADWPLSARDPVADAWDSVADKDEWDLRMAVHAAMIDRMDQGIGRVMTALREAKMEENTLVLFLSDNGASAEALDSWPNPGRGHKPGSVVGTAESHRCLEVGWANAANTPFREHKMWVHEGGISTPLIASWPKGIKARGQWSDRVGHIIDISPTLIELAGATYPKERNGQMLIPLEGKSFANALRGEESTASRDLFWEHEGNRAVRSGDWKLVARYQGDWELYNLARDRTETKNLAAAEPALVRELEAKWNAWAKRVGVVDWSELPGASYRPAPGYRKKSEPVPAASAKAKGQPKAKAKAVKP